MDIVEWNNAVIAFRTALLGDVGNNNGFGAYLMYEPRGGEIIDYAFPVNCGNLSGQHIAVKGDESYVYGYRENGRWLLMKDGQAYPDGLTTVCNPHDDADFKAAYETPNENAAASLEILTSIIGRMFIGENKKAEKADVDAFILLIVEPARSEQIRLKMEQKLMTVENPLINLHKLWGAAQHWQKGRGPKTRDDEIKMEEAINAL
ncbi:hypothetical protein [Thalassotalea fusca]